MVGLVKCGFVNVAEFLEEVLSGSGISGESCISKSYVLKLGGVRRKGNKSTRHDPLAKQAPELVLLRSPRVVRQRL